MAKITAIATGVPAHRYLQTDLFNFAAQAYTNNETDARKLRFLYNHSGINARHSILPDFTMPAADRTFFSGAGVDRAIPDVKMRMALYEENAVPLSVATINECISNKIATAEITHLITVSCTGISAPGLDLLITETMGLQHSIVRTSVNFMGCYAAVHAMKLADAFCRSTENANVIVVCTEFCSLHFQQDPSPDNLTSSLIFADGCAAFLMQSDAKAKGIKINNFYSEVLFNGKKDMAWGISPNGFEMTLSGYIPDLIKTDFSKLVENALAKSNSALTDITHWCIHPGGKKILEAIADTLGLEKDRFNYSYDVLRDYGNMSSPTILFVLKKILDELNNTRQDERAIIFGAAFGPGLTMETFTASYD